MNASDPSFESRAPRMAIAVFIIAAIDALLWTAGSQLPGALRSLSLQLLINGMGFIMVQARVEGLPNAINRFRNFIAWYFALMSLSSFCLSVAAKCASQEVTSGIMSLLGAALRFTAYLFLCNAMLSLASRHERSWKGGSPWVRILVLLLIILSATPLFLIPIRLPYTLGWLTAMYRPFLSLLALAGFFVMLGSAGNSKYQRWFTGLLGCFITAKVIAEVLGWIFDAPNANGAGAFDQAYELITLASDSIALLIGLAITSTPLSAAVGTFAGVTFDDDSDLETLAQSRLPLLITDAGNHVRFVTAGIVQETGIGHERWRSESPFAFIAPSYALSRFGVKSRSNWDAVWLVQLLEHKGGKLPFVLFFMVLKQRENTAGYVWLLRPAPDVNRQLTAGYCRLVRDLLTTSVTRRIMTGVAEPALLVQHCATELASSYEVMVAAVFQDQTVPTRDGGDRVLVLRFRSDSSADSVQLLRLTPTELAAWETGAALPPELQRNFGLTRSLSWAMIPFEHRAWWLFLLFRWDAPVDAVTLHACIQPVFELLDHLTALSHSERTLDHSLPLVRAILNLRSALQPGAAYEYPLQLLLKSCLIAFQCSAVELWTRDEPQQPPTLVHRWSPSSAVSGNLGGNHSRQPTEAMVPDMTEMRAAETSLTEAMPNRGATNPDRREIIFNRQPSGQGVLVLENAAALRELPTTDALLQLLRWQLEQSFTMLHIQQQISHIDAELETLYPELRTWEARIDQVKQEITLINEKLDKGYREG